MSRQPLAPPPRGRGHGDETAPLARGTAHLVLAQQKPQPQQQQQQQQQVPPASGRGTQTPLVERLQAQINKLAGENASLRREPKIREKDTAAHQAVAGLRGQIAQARQANQNLHIQLRTTQHELHELRTTTSFSVRREDHLAALIKSCRLQLPCHEGLWTESQRLLSLEDEVEALREFVEYQYQTEMLWGSEEVRNPRFWYEGGGFRGVEGNGGRRIGPDGDLGEWVREKWGG